MENKSKSPIEENWNDNDNDLLIGFIAVIIFKLVAIYKLRQKIKSDRTATNVFLMNTLITMTGVMTSLLLNYFRQDVAEWFGFCFTYHLYFCLVICLILHLPLVQGDIFYGIYRPLLYHEHITEVRADQACLLVKGIAFAISFPFFLSVNSFNCDQTRKEFISQKLIKWPMYGGLLLLFLVVFGVSYYLGRVQLMIKKSDEERNARMNIMAIQITDNEANIGSTSRPLPLSIETRKERQTVNDDKQLTLGDGRNPLHSNEKNHVNFSPKIIAKTNKVSASPNITETKEEIVMNVRRVNDACDEFIRVVEPRSTLVAPPASPHEPQYINIIQQQLKIIRYGVSLNLSLFLTVLLIIASVMVEQIFCTSDEKVDSCGIFVLHLIRLPKLLSMSVLSGFTLYHIKQY